MNGSMTPRRVGLVGCVSEKLDHPATARNLYDSPLFHGRRRYVEESCGEWFILSAKRHLVKPEEIIAPYEESLVGQTTDCKRAWAQQVLRDLDGLLGNDLREIEIEIHAGADYRDFGLVEGLKRRGAKVFNPVEGLGIGRQLQFYGGDSKTILTEGIETIVPRRREIRRYASIGAYLAKKSERRTRVSFSEIETMIGRPLPRSARTYRAWWANDRSHSHARVWMDEGWKAEDVNLTSERVVFARVRQD